MHIVAATNNLFPESNATGSGRYNHEVGKQLVERGHTVSVITRQRGDRPSSETVAGMDVRRYRASIPRLPSTLREIDRLVGSIAEKEPIDVVSFHGALSSFGVDRAVPDRVPRIYTIHGLWAAEYRQKVSDASRLLAPWCWLNGELRQRIESRVVGRSDSVVVLSEFMRKRLREFHPNAPTSTVIPGGVDTERFSPRYDPPTEMASRDTVDFLTVRRLTRRMGIETLLKAFARVTEANADTHLYIGGDGPLRSELETRARRLGIESAVTFLGYVPEDRLARTYAAADVFVLPTTALEGFGLATVEALSTETPVIGTKVGATPEILGNLESKPAVPERLLVDAEAPGQLGSLMAAWAELSPEEREKAGTSCRSYVVESGYTWTQIADRIEQRMHDLRGERPRSTAQ